MGDRFLEDIDVDKNQGRLFKIKCLYDLIQQGFGRAVKSMEFAQIVI